MGTGNFNAGGSPAMDFHPIQGGVKILLVTSATETGPGPELMDHLARMQTFRKMRWKSGRGHVIQSPCYYEVNPKKNSIYFFRNSSELALRTLSRKVHDGATEYKFL